MTEVTFKVVLQTNRSNRSKSLALLYLIESISSMTIKRRSQQGSIPKRPRAHFNASIRILGRNSAAPAELS